MTERAGDPRFYALLEEIAALHARKSSDYAPGHDPLANFKASAEFGVRPYLGLLTRLRDKWGRITTAAKGGQLQNEALRDSHIDSAVYHLLAVLLLEDERPEQSSSSGETLNESAIDPSRVDISELLPTRPMVQFCPSPVHHELAQHHGCPCAACGWSTEQPPAPPLESRPPQFGAGQNTDTPLERERRMCSGADPRYFELCPNPAAPAERPARICFDELLAQIGYVPAQEPAAPAEAPAPPMSPSGNACDMCEKQLPHAYCSDGHRHPPQFGAGQNPQPQYVGEDGSRDHEWVAPV